MIVVSYKYAKGLEELDTHLYLSRFEVVSYTAQCYPNFFCTNLVN